MILRHAEACCDEVSRAAIAMIKNKERSLEWYIERSSRDGQRRHNINTIFRIDNEERG
jgi:hypothetical protein